MPIAPILASGDSIYSLFPIGLFQQSLPKLLYRMEYHVSDECTIVLRPQPLWFGSLVGNERGTVPRKWQPATHELSYVRTYAKQFQTGHGLIVSHGPGVGDICHSMSMLPLLNELHWIPIGFQVMIITFEAFHGIVSNYLWDPID